MIKVILITFSIITVTNNILPWLISIIKARYENSSKANLKKIRKTKLIYNILTIIGKNLGAYRVAIIRYQDGKASMTDEWVKDEKNSIISMFQDKRSSAIADVLESLESEGYAIVNNNSNPKIIEIHQFIGIDTSYKFKIFDSISKGNLVIGFSGDRILTTKEWGMINSYIKQLKTIK